MGILSIVRVWPVEIGEDEVDRWYHDNGLWRADKVDLLYGGSKLEVVSRPHWTPAMPAGCYPAAGMPSGYRR